MKGSVGIEESGKLLGGSKAKRFTVDYLPARLKQRKLPMNYFENMVYAPDGNSTFLER